MNSSVTKPSDVPIGETFPVSVEWLVLDRENPRLVGNDPSVSDEAVIAQLFKGEELGELLQSIAPDIIKTTNMILDIASATTEQSNGSDQINTAIQQMNKVVQHNAATSEELAANSEELNSQAMYMKELIAFFRV